MKRYVYYQPNDKDITDKFGDCQVRALTKALGKNWLDTYDLMHSVCRRYQVMMPFDCPMEIRKSILDELGFEYIKVPVKKGKPRTTVESFAKEHPQGSYILDVAHHNVACVDGKYFDTWDSGDYCVYVAWKKKGEEE